jgi:hypothetical protein
MRLDEYQWSHNPRGMHNNRAAHHFNVSWLIQMHMGWGKIVAVDREFMNVIPQMMGSNITPIVRLWRPNFGASAYAPDMLAAWKEYMAAGVRWFEFYNEPNLGNEWPENTPPVLGRKDHRDGRLSGVPGAGRSRWRAVGCHKLADRHADLPGRQLL